MSNKKKQAPKENSFFAQFLVEHLAPMRSFDEFTVDTDAPDSLYLSSRLTRNEQTITIEVSPDSPFEVMVTIYGVKDSIIALINGDDDSDQSAWTFVTDHFPKEVDFDNNDHDFSLTCYAYPDRLVANIVTLLKEIDLIATVTEDYVKRKQNNLKSLKETLDQFVKNTL